MLASIASLLLVALVNLPASTAVRAADDPPTAAPRPSTSRKALNRAIDDHRFTTGALQEAETQAKDAAEKVDELAKNLRESEKRDTDPGVLKVLRAQLKEERKKLDALQAEVRAARRNHRVAQSSLKRIERRAPSH